MLNYKIKMKAKNDIELGILGNEYVGKTCICERLKN